MGATPKEYLEVFQDCERRVSGHHFVNRLLHILVLRRLAQAENDKLTKLRTYAEVQLIFEQFFMELEAFATTAKAEYTNLIETIIPELFDELEIPFLGLSDTQKIEVAQKTTARLSKDKADAGCDWLVDHGQGALVKKEVGYKFGVKEDELAAKVIAAMKEAGVEPKVERTVHHSTLSAYVRNALEEGKEIPFDLFGVYQRRASTITEKSK